MLFEILSLTPIAIAAWATLRVTPNYVPFEDTNKALPVVEATSDVTTLVIELLRSDEGWKEIKLKPNSSMYISYEKCWEHNTGVRIKDSESYYRGGDSHRTTALYVKNDMDVYQHAQTTKADDDKIRSELQAFHDRKRDAQQRALTRALASRIVAQESGVRPLLESSSASGDDDSSSVDGERSNDSSLPAGFLVYDEHGGQITTVGSKDGQISLDAALKMRYNIPVKKSVDVTRLANSIRDNYASY